MRFQGGGSSHIRPTKMTNAIEAIREKGYQVTYIQGYQNETEELGEKQLQDTIEKLKQEYRKKDCVILYFIGLTESYEGEGYDRKNLKIPQNQEELLAEIAETVGKDHIAAISFGGAPMDFSFEKNVGAIKIKNIGKVSGAEIAQLYVCPNESDVIGASVHDLQLKANIEVFTGGIQHDDDCHVK